MAIEIDTSRPRGRLRTAARAGIITAVGVAIAAAIVRRWNSARTHISFGISIDRPVPEVFAFVADARNVLQWLPSATERRKVTEGPIGTGTHYEAVDRLGSGSIAHSQEIIAFEPDRLVTTRMSEPWNATYEIRTWESAGGTLLTVDATGQASGLYHLVDLVPSALLTRMFERDYARLKVLLERGDERPSASDESLAGAQVSGKPLVAIPIEPEESTAVPAPDEVAVG